jgi:hypothetical protein
MICILQINLIFQSLNIHPLYTCMYLNKNYTRYDTFGEFTGFFPPFTTQQSTYPYGSYYAGNNSLCGVV